MLDRDFENPYIQLFRHTVTRENIGELVCSRYGAPAVFDVLSIDVDGMDIFLWTGLKPCRARVVVIEACTDTSTPAEDSAASTGAPRRRVCKLQEYKADYRWSGNGEHKAPLDEVKRVATELGYTFVTASEHNAFFVDNALSDAAAAF